MTMTVAALVPISITTSHDFSRHKLPHDNVNCKCPLPYIRIPLPKPWHCSRLREVSDGTSVNEKSGGDKGTPLIVGKQKLIQTCSSACGCLEILKVPCKKEAATVSSLMGAASTSTCSSQHQQPVEVTYKSCYRVSSKCQRCTEFQNWALKYISSKMISIQPSSSVSEVEKEEEMEVEVGTGTGTGTLASVEARRKTTESETINHGQPKQAPFTSWRVELIGMNPKIVFINGEELKKGKDHAVVVHEGSEISFRNPQRRILGHNPGGDKDDDTYNATSSHIRTSSDEFIVFQIGQVIEKMRTGPSALQRQNSCTTCTASSDEVRVDSKVVGTGTTENHKPKNEHGNKHSNGRGGIDSELLEQEDKGSDLERDTETHTQLKNNLVVPKQNEEAMKVFVSEKKDTISSGKAAEGDISNRVKEGAADPDGVEVRLDRAKTARISNRAKGTEGGNSGGELLNDAKYRPDEIKKRLYDNTKIIHTDTGSGDLQSEFNNRERKVINESGAEGEALESEAQHQKLNSSDGTIGNKKERTMTSESLERKGREILLAGEQENEVMVFEKKLEASRTTMVEVQVDKNPQHKTDPESPTSRSSRSSMMDQLKNNQPPTPNDIDTGVAQRPLNGESNTRKDPASPATVASTSNSDHAGSEPLNDSNENSTTRKEIIDLISPECKKKRVLSGRKGDTIEENSSTTMEDEVEILQSPESETSQPLHVPPKIPCTIVGKAKQLASAPRKVAAVIDLASDDSQPQASVASMKVDPVYAAFFLPLGKTMSRNRIKILSQSLKRRDPTLTIQTEFDKTHVPKYIVVDATLTLKAVQSALGFNSINDMKRLSEDIFFVVPGWVNQKGNLHSPTLEQCWVGSHELKKRKRGHEDSPSLRSQESSGGWIKKMRRVHEFAPVTKISAAEVNNPVIDYLHKRKKNMNADRLRDLNMTNQKRNLELSNLLSDISKIYKECPLQKFDHWRSYSYSRCAGRLQYLDFDVTLEKQSLDRLSKVAGFGSKTVKQCKDFLATGKCELIEEFSRDKMRRGMGNMSKIWGVGEATASDLVKKGYYNIKQIRSALQSGELKLDPRQLVGVEFYEQFQEKMERHEVRQIGKIVEEAVRVRFPDAEVTTMGSYRRGAVQSGDVDVLIVHKKYTKTTPLGALDELVERLKAKGHITHHLTYVDPHYFEEMPTQSCDFHDSIFPPYRDRAQTYMGVFGSPFIKGKHRRIDIKFYPYREKAYATLYFTGNTFFNRSIRLYAKRRKNMRLNDHGLFEIQQDSGMDGPRIKCRTEKDIFDKMGLIYREPHERDSFDAVRVKCEDDSKDGEIFQEDLSQADIDVEARELRKHGWID